MNVLLLGATGFIGRHLAHALQAQGHQVMIPETADGARINMALMTMSSAWLPHLQGTQVVDAVINAVGVLREGPHQPMDVVHTAAPIALFTACAQAGVGIRRVIQISALGIEGVDTLYASTKREADAALLALTEQGRLDGVVLRPSIVIGQGGASTALFQALARFPVMLWPKRAQTCQVQPLSVDDLAWGCIRLLTAQRHVTGVLSAVGAERASIAKWVARVRALNGREPALVGAVPNVFAALSARLGDAMPFTPWGRDTWALLSQDNVAEADDWIQVLGRKQAPALDYLAQCAMKNKNLRRFQC